MQLAMPLIIGQVAMIAIWTADIVMMGWISSEALAAGVQANRLYQPFYFIALGLTTVVGPLTAQALGTGSRRQARRYIRHGLLLATVFGLLTMIPMWHGETLLLLLGQEAGLAENAGPFLKAVAPGMVPTYMYFALRNYISAYKKPLPPVIVTIIGAVVNILLNLALTRGWAGFPEMGLAGIGLATSITFTIMTIMLIVYMNTFPPFRFTRSFARLYRIDLAIIRRMLIVGVPIAFTLLAETGMFIFTGLYIGIFGTSAVAASGIANQIAAVVFMVPLAVGQASTIRVGHEAGARKGGDTLRAGFAPVILTIGFGLVLSLLLLLFTEAAITAFLNADDPDYAAVMALTVPMLLVVAFFQVFDGLQVVFSCVLRGVNDTKIPAILSVLSYWGVGVTMAIVLSTPMGYGAVGVWWGLLLGLLAGSLMLGWRCYSTWRRIAQGGRILVV